MFPTIKMQFNFSKEKKRGRQIATAVDLHLLYGNKISLRYFTEVQAGKMQINKGITIIHIHANLIAPTLGSS